MSYLVFCTLTVILYRLSTSFVVEKTGLANNLAVVQAFVTIFHRHSTGFTVASSPGPFEKSEKRAWYPLFAHALN